MFAGCKIDRERERESEKKVNEYNALFVSIYSYQGYSTYIVVFHSS